MPATYLPDVTGAAIATTVSPLHVPLEDCYTNVERTLYLRLMEVMTSQQRVYPVLNQMASKKDLEAPHAAISLIKAGDIPDQSQGGGTNAFVFNPVRNSEGDLVMFNKEPWPRHYKLLYQIHILADQGYLAELRYLEAVIRTAFPPPPYNSFLIYDARDPDNVHLSEDRAEAFYGGYINRDIPENDLYWRVMNLKVEVSERAQPFERTSVPVIQSVDFSIEAAGAPLQFTVR